MNEPITIFVLLTLGVSVMLAYYLRRVATLQKEAREHPIPPSVDEITKEVIVHTYQVQFQLKRLQKNYPDPLSALVAALHGGKRNGVAR